MSACCIYRNPPLFFTSSGPTKCGNFITKLEGGLLTLHIPKPSLCKINHLKSHCVVWFKALFSLLLLLNLAMKAKANGTVIQMTEANTVPCAPRERPKKKYWGAFYTLPQFFTAFANMKLAFWGTAPLRESLAVDINILHSVFFLSLTFTSSITQGA